MRQKRPADLLTVNQKKDKEIFRRIFEENWDNFKDKNPVYDSDQYEVPVQKMLNCGKESGGYCEYICMKCGRDLRRVCFSCKSCFCLSCAKVYADNMVSQVSKMLHPGVIYRHNILTIPEQLRQVFYDKKRPSGGLKRKQLWYPLNLPTRRFSLVAFLLTLAF